MPENNGTDAAPKAISRAIRDFDDLGVVLETEMPIDAAPHVIIRMYSKREYDVIRQDRDRLYAGFNQHLEQLRERIEERRALLESARDAAAAAKREILSECRQSDIETLDWVLALLGQRTVARTAESLPAEAQS